MSGNVETERTVLGTLSIQVCISLPAPFQGKPLIASYASETNSVQHKVALQEVLPASRIISTIALKTTQKIKSFKNSYKKEIFLVRQKQISFKNYFIFINSFTVTANKRNV